MNGKFLVTLLALLSLAGIPHSAVAFTLLRGPAGQVTTGWSGSTVTFDIDSSCASYLDLVHDAIDSASNTWGAVSTSKLKVARGTTVTLAQPITTYVGSTATSY